jgi:hypothetical protein
LLILRRQDAFGGFSRWVPEQLRLSPSPFEDDGSEEVAGR